MKHIIQGALSIVMSRIRNCGTQLSSVSDQYSVHYWQNELNKQLNLKMRIEKRFKTRHNVLYVDFINKKRVA